MSKKRTDLCYFGAGPAPMPTPVLEAGAQAFVNYEGSGLSLAEISHRSPTATKILADTKEALVSLLDIPNNYEVLFMHGGGSGQFAAVVYNMVPVWIEQRRRAAEKELGQDQEAILQRVRKELREKLRLDYLVTGSWSLKASQEAANLLGPLGQDFVNIATDSRQGNGGKFGTIPPENSWNLSCNKCGSAFVFYCDNVSKFLSLFFPFGKILLNCYPKKERSRRLCRRQLTAWNSLISPRFSSLVMVSMGGLQFPT